jgi:ectoine hydroxylase-related dioxygenase (phytanoyl-CoA dioxygenase family)
MSRMRPGAAERGSGLRLHPRNRGFRWSMPRPPHRILDGEQAASFDERGFFVLRGAFTPAELAAVVAEIDPIEAKVAAVLRGHPQRRIFIAEDGNITFSMHLVKRSPRLRAFCRHRVFGDLASDLVGPDVRLYWDQAVYKKPERPGVFPWHQDNGYSYVEPQQYLACWLALSDATRESGCPWVAPGLHRMGTLEHRLTTAGWQCLEADPADAVAVEAEAGSLVVFSSLTPHKTGPNLTSQVRKAYIVQFAPEGAVAWRAGTEPELQDDRERQFPILSHGEPVAGA